MRIWIWTGYGPISHPLWSVSAFSIFFSVLSTPASWWEAIIAWLLSRPSCLGKGRLLILVCPCEKRISLALCLLAKILLKDILFKRISSLSMVGQYIESFRSSAIGFHLRQSDDLVFYPLFQQCHCLFLTSNKWRQRRKTLASFIHLLYNPLFELESRAPLIFFIVITEIVSS